ncbi:single-pass membrane and coiled-coil domain-containing protein 2 [Moschus berezovskii]|uniref:single-pass membrane and coiled-coil domain-containing protein 2 n=1 Tax=Moschus berezovskii TaxID=68408 RepID=UPI002444033E|nr:single-pass membrane and coiled-coil domain-containing protein 2 [Moschus berezovskii]
MANRCNHTLPGGTFGDDEDHKDPKSFLILRPPLRTYWTGAGQVTGSEDKLGSSTHWVGQILGSELAEHARKPTSEHLAIMTVDEKKSRRKTAKVVNSKMDIQTRFSDEMALQMKPVGKEQELTEKNNGFFQNIDGTEGTVQKSGLSSQGSFVRYCLETSSGWWSLTNPSYVDAAGLELPRHDKLKLKAGCGQDLQSEQDEQERDHVQQEDPQVATSLQFSDENILEQSQENMFFQLNHWNTRMGLQVKELGADHIGWMEKIKNIIQKISLTENTMKSLLSEVISLEGQIEKLESHQDLDSDQGVNMEVSACDEAHKLKEKLVARIENFCKDMALLVTKLGMYQMQGNPDSQSPEEMGTDEREPLLPQASPPSLESSPPHITMWKRALRIFIMFYVLTLTGLSCYILFFDATFIFEKVLPTILGRRRMWELREILVPFLNLEVEDLLPS